MKPERNPAHLKFVRSLPCSVPNCRKLWGIEAAHVGPRGLGQKASDLSTIPLCNSHHRDREVGIHHLGRAAFEDLHGVNIDQLVKLTQRRAAACGLSEAQPVERIARKPIVRAAPISGLRGSRLAR